MVVRVEKTMITQIAQLHIKSFKNYFFTKLGKKLIMKCYEYYVDNGDIFLCNLNSDKSIDGFLLFVFKESMARDKFIKKYKVLILIRYFLLALTGDIVVWKKALKIAKSAFMKTNKLVNPSLPYILSICVHENSRGKGVAPLMIDELEKKLINQGIHKYKLTVRSTNSSAIKMYMKVGFKFLLFKGDESVYVKEI